MRWEPEYGWTSLVGRWAVVAGAGVILGVAAFGDGRERPGPLALDPTATRVVELDRQVQSELRNLVPARGPDPAAPASDRSADTRPTAPSGAGAGGRDESGERAAAADDRGTDGADRELSGNEARDEPPGSSEGQTGEEPDEDEDRDEPAPGDADSRDDNDESGGDGDK